MADALLGIETSPADILFDSPFERFTLADALLGIETRGLPRVGAVGFGFTLADALLGIETWVYYWLDS